MAESDDESYTIPLRDQRYFGAGLKRKRVRFIPSSSSAESGLPKTFAASALSPSDRYLSIVFNSASFEPIAVQSAQSSTASENRSTTSLEQSAIGAAGLQVGQPKQFSDNTVAVCDVCRLPILAAGSAVPHENSVAHQVCLPHAHPPSALDRTRKGVSILQAYGWNPDQRLGLGASGTGILHPVKAKDKRDTIGLGAGNEEAVGKVRKRQEEPKQTVKTLDAGRMRKLDDEARRRDKKLRDLFYSNDEVERYLGGG